MKDDEEEESWWKGRKSTTTTQIPSSPTQQHNHNKPDFKCLIREFKKASSFFNLPHFFCSLVIPGSGCITSVATWVFQDLAHFTVRRHRRFCALRCPTLPSSRGGVDKIEIVSQVYMRAFLVHYPSQVLRVKSSLYTSSPFSSLPPFPFPNIACCLLAAPTSISISRKHGNTHR